MLLLPESSYLPFEDSSFTVYYLRTWRFMHQVRGELESGKYISQSVSQSISSVAQSCPTLCNPMNRSTPGLPVHHQLPRVHSDSCPLSQWCHPAISSSVVPFSSCPLSLPASESFPVSQLFTWGGQYCWPKNWGGRSMALGQINLTSKTGWALRFPSFGFNV